MWNLKKWSQMNNFFAGLTYGNIYRHNYLVLSDASWNCLLILSLDKVVAYLYLLWCLPLLHKSFSRRANFTTAAWKYTSLLTTSHRHIRYYISLSVGGRWTNKITTTFVVKTLPSSAQWLRVMLWRHCSWKINGWWYRKEWSSVITTAPPTYSALVLVFHFVFLLFNTY